MLLLVLCFTAAGCELFEKSLSSSPSANYLFFSLGAAGVTGGPARAPFQDRFVDDTFIFDLDHLSTTGDPSYLCEHDVAGTRRKRLEVDIPTDTDCMASLVLDPPAIPMVHTGPDGTNPTPVGYREWPGGRSGGCGTWAVAMCSRILHATDPSTNVTRDEWSSIATSINQDAEGGSFIEDRTKYFQSLGYCVVDKRFDGTAADYAEARSYWGRNCDLKISMWRNAGGEYSNGHVETITRVNDDDTLTTNSWGQSATIRGGTGGGFSHTPADGALFRANDGSVAWPPSQTETWISYVCPCGDFEALGNLLVAEADRMRMMP